jgi:cytoskeletal protein RodZ
MTDSAASLLAILLGLGVFAIIVSVGWRSVQNRRILRFQDAHGKETIIVAGEDDDVSSVSTATTETTQSRLTPAPSDLP